MKIVLKICNKCFVSRSEEDFYRNKGMSDGRLKKCKYCSIKDYNEYRQNNLKKCREYDRNRGNLEHRIEARKEYQKTDNYKESRLIANRNYRNKYPKKDKARSAVNNAIRDGILFKQPCFICGEKAEAHHPDYNRPLDVVWLCDRHHKEVHMMFKKYD